MDITSALSFASLYHGKQTDKVGAPYMFHIMDVWKAVHAKGYDATHQIVAILHDIVEDTDMTVREVEKYFGKDVASAVDAITKRDGESNENYLARVISNPIARVVKKCDSENNLSRIDNITDPDTKDRLRKKYTYNLTIL